MNNEMTDLLTQLDRAQTPAKVWSAASKHLERCGITHSIYIFVDTRNPANSSLWTSLPQAWQARYLERGYQAVDPFFRYCCRTFSPIRTGPDYLADHDYLTMPERRIILEGGETGFRSGFSSPTRLLGGTSFGGWNFGSSMPRNEFEMFAKEQRDNLRLAGFYVHEHLQRLSRSEDGVLSPPLTPRERECLLWLSRGLRTAAIADRLGIAVVTVDLHIKGARQKLAAATREEALAKAILSGQICP